MDDAQSVIFGEFPREAATPERFMLFNEEHFDRYLEKCINRYNLYSSVASINKHGYVFDKIYYDCDTLCKENGDVSHEKVSPSMTDADIFSLMRQDKEFADDILWPVIQDVRKLVEQSISDGLDVVGVFSGYGIHVYQFYQPKLNPQKELYSTIHKYKSELSLNTVDGKVHDVRRIMRIPNVPRMCGEENKYETGVWTIPLTADEMLQVDSQWLLHHSKGPRSLSVKDFNVNPSEAPEMNVYKEHLDSFTRIEEVQAEPRELLEHEIADENIIWLLENVLKMPCMYEHAMQPNPNHEIRVNFAVMMFNLGYNINETHAIIRKLNWKDYNRETTMEQLRQIYRRKYADMSCKTLMTRGYCVYYGEEQECPTYKWSGGNQKY